MFPVSLFQKMILFASDYEFSLLPEPDIGGPVEPVWPWFIWAMFVGIGLAIIAVIALAIIVVPKIIKKSKAKKQKKTEEKA